MSLALANMWRKIHEHFTCGTVSIFSQNHFFDTNMLCGRQWDKHLICCWIEMGATMVPHLPDDILVFQTWYLHPC